MSEYPPDPPRAGASVGRRLGLIGAATALAVSAGLAGGYVVHRLDTSPSVRSASGSPVAVVDRSSLASIAAAVQPSVVDIATGSGEGSGVVLTADGTILTNNHVVASARGCSLVVTFTNDRTARATVTGTDPAGDLAVVKADGVSDLTPAKFGNSDALRPGDTVLALGSPLGLRGSVTAGIVSALHRTLDTETDGATRRSISDAIQTDAAINPGNSGGPLANTAAEVIGINTAIATSGEGAGNIGLGFAIPSNRAKSSADQLVKGGKVSHPYLGIQVSDAGGGGALVLDVEAGSPADKAGLRRGDLVTKVGSQRVTGAAVLVAAVQAGKPGDQLALTVTRDGAAREVTVTLGEA